nr:DUF6264 family protein [Microbacterium hydrocarbonoxydans]
MTDQRPQYGEIATLEEQRRAAGLPPIAEVVPESSVSAQRPAIPEAPASSRAGRPVDRFITIALLAYGLVNVVMTALSYLDFSTAMNEVMGLLGIDGEFTNYAQGRLWGTIAALVLAVGWSVTAYLSIRRLRRGRATWWLPIVGALVTTIVASVCVAIPMMGDPAFVSFLTSSALQ